MIFIERYEFTYQDYLNYCNSFCCHDFNETMSFQENSVPYILDEKLNKSTGDKKHDKNCIEIIRSAVIEQKLNKATYKYPKIVQIVIYTGNMKWKASNSFAMSQIYKEGYEDEIIDISYKLIDVNKYEIETLLQYKTLLTNVMILEKCKNNEEVIICLKKIIANSKSTNIEELKRIVTYLYNDIEETSKKEIIKIIEESESEETMSTIQERIGAEFRNERKIGRSEGIAQGIAQGLAQAIKQTIERMIKMNLEDEIIEQATGTEKREIEKIRKEVSK